MIYRKIREEIYDAQIDRFHPANTGIAALTAQRPLKQVR